MTSKFGSLLPQERKRLYYITGAGVMTALVIGLAFSLSKTDFGQYTIVISTLLGSLATAASGFVTMALSVTDYNQPTNEITAGKDKVSGVK